MHFKDSIQDFIYDQSHYISTYDKNIYVFNYEKILDIQDKQIKIKFANFILLVNGSNLNVKKMLKNELLFTGNLKELKVINEK